MAVRPSVLVLLLLSIPAAAPLSGQEGGKSQKGTTSTRPLRPSPDPDLQKLLADYEIKEKDFPWELREIRAGERWTSSWLTFPSAVAGEPEENRTVWAKLWQPAEPARGRPAVLLLHWLGGSFDLLEIIGQRLAENGIVSLMMYMPHYGPRRARDRERRRTLLGGRQEEALAGIRQAVLDARRAGDWLAARPDVDPARVGLVGISLGAVVGSLAAGVDDHFSRCAFVIGGGDLPAIILHGSRETAEQKRRLEEEGCTADRLRELWKAIEPCTFASRMQADDVLMINAEEDEIVPRASTEKLHEAIGRPEIRWLKGGHYGIVLHIGTVLRDITAHVSQLPALRPDPGAGPPRIRVLLLEAAREAPIEIRGPYALRVRGAPDEREERLAPSTLRAEGERIALGSRFLAAPRFLLVPDRGGDLLVDGRAHDGSIEVLRGDDGAFAVVNEVDLESYVAGVAGPEIGAEAPLEALKAQAVASRTFAWTALGRDGPFDVYADTRSQVYRGRPAAGGPAGRAAGQTRGQMLFWRGRPFRAYFSSTCGGATESASEALGVADIPPLAGTACGNCEGARRAAWSVVIPEADFKVGPFTGLAARSLTRSGRVREAAFSFEDGTNRVVPARDLRAALGWDRLPSTRFEAVKEGAGVRINGRGWGHGCGLCQEGALGMARAGRSCGEILGKYYPGAEVRKAYGR